MFPSRDKIMGLAACNPRLAAILAAGSYGGLPRVGFQWTTYSATIVMEQGVSISPGQVYPFQLDDLVTDDFYVTAWRYTVEQPNNNPGSILQGQQQYFNALIPNIDMLGWFTGWAGKYPSNLHAAPLQSVIGPPNVPSDCSSKGWVLTAGSSFVGNLYPTRTMTGAEVPTKVVITLEGLSIGSGCYSDLTVPELRERLMKNLIASSGQKIANE